MDSFRPAPAGILAGIVIVTAAVHFSLRGPAARAAESAAASSGRITPAEIVAGAAPSVGLVLTARSPAEPQVLGLATATAPGTFATTCHGIEPTQPLYVRIEGVSHPATLLVGDQATGVCVLEVPGVEAPPLPVVSEARKGQVVHVMGANARGELALTEAVVKQVRETPAGEKAYELSVPIARNGSGGPIFDDEGNVVGMATTQHAYGAGLEIAIPGEAIAEAQALAQAPLA